MTLRYSIIASVIAAACLALFLRSDRDYKILEVPRPNSGTYSTAEATKLLPDFLSRATGIESDHDLIQSWESPTQGIHVHVDRDGTIRTKDFFGSESTGLQSFGDAIDRTPVWGNAVSVLMTSDRDGWESNEKNQIVERAFVPRVQLYVATNQ